MNLDIDLIATEGNDVNPSKIKGTAIFYFYPKDMTPGCTIEACNFRDNIDEFEALNVQVYGVSTDNTDSHYEFIEKHSLPFTLLSDTNGSLSKSLGIYDKMEWEGKKFNGAKRTTLIVKDGKIIKIFENVNPNCHADEILEFLESK